MLVDDIMEETDREFTEDEDAQQYMASETLIMPKTIIQKTFYRNINTKRNIHLDTYE